MELKVSKISFESNEKKEILPFNEGRKETSIKNIGSTAVFLIFDKKTEYGNEIEILLPLDATYTLDGTFKGAVFASSETGGKVEVNG